jgi:uncharacterized protein (DUF2267 family)
MDHDQFTDLVAERADVPHERAGELIRATLTTLAERITGGEARHIAERLPVRLRTPLVGAAEEAEGFSFDEFIRRVADRADVDRDTADIGMAAVLTTLRDAIGADEYHRMMSQLPLEFHGLMAGPRLQDVRTTGDEPP